MRVVAIFNVGRADIPDILHFDPNITLTTKTRAKHMGKELPTTKKAKKNPNTCEVDSRFEPGYARYYGPWTDFRSSRRNYQLCDVRLAPVLVV